MRAVMAGCFGQMFGTALYAVLPYAHDPATFAVIMLLDNFAIALAGVTLIAYMSSLTSLGYTATQYALLSSTYAWAGKILKGFSGTAVETMTAHIGLMNAYAAFFIGCGLLGVPALVLFATLDRRPRWNPATSLNPTNFTKISHPLGSPHALGLKLSKLSQMGSKPMTGTRVW